MSDIQVFPTRTSTLENEARIFGAKHKRIFYTYHYDCIYGKRPDVFSVHFFDEEDKEVGYYIEDLKSVCGMTIFSSPREWSEEIKNHTDYKLYNYL